MHPDDDSQTTLSKWPFILGDVLLVATALAIAILGGWQLTNWQVGACVAAVALGAALFVLPYVVEYLVRVREEQEDRAGDLRILEKHLLNAEQELTAIDARMRTLECAVAEAARPDVELAEMIDEKIAPLESSRASQSETLDALQQKLEGLFKERLPAFDPEILEPINKRLTALEALPEPSAVPPDPVPVEKPAPAPPAPSTGKETAPEKPAKTLTHLERPKRAARERHAPEEARLLQRAITEKGDNSSAAVSRIIEAKAKEPSSRPASSEPEEKEAPAPEPEANASPPKKKDDTQPEASEEAREDTPETGPSDMLFDEEKITSPVIRTKAKKNDAVVTASVFIGIGNKPYLRGDGGGLSWEKGVAMEFQEIGKWRWVAPSDLDHALEVQLYCNDEDPDKSGKYTLEPGQKLELAPVF